MSQARETLEVRRCGNCKRGGGFTKVCSPLSYNTNERAKKLIGSNPFIYTDVVKNKCIRVTSPCIKKKKKWPMMRGNSSQTSDIISKDKTTQFPDDLIHNIQNIEVVEYEVTKETGEKEVIVTKTESLTKFISSKNNENKDLQKTESITKFDGTGKQISKELITLYEPNPSFNKSAEKMESTNKNYGSSENAQNLKPHLESLVGK
nr:uncharacterized protein LOC26530902 isoform X4 [Drosophila virilis]